MSHFEELYPNRFLKGVTLERPLTIRIVSVSGEMLAGDDGAKAKAILRYRSANGEGEIVWAKTNSILTAAILGADYKQWGGHLITIAFNPTVQFGAEKVGGIRVIGSPELTGPVKVDVKRPRRKTVEKYTLVPTDKHGQERKPATPATEPAPVRERDVGEEG